MADSVCCVPCKKLTFFSSKISWHVAGIGAPSVPLRPHCSNHQPPECHAASSSRASQANGRPCAEETAKGAAEMEAKTARVKCHGRRLGLKMTMLVFLVLDLMDAPMLWLVFCIATSLFTLVSRRKRGIYLDRSTCEVGKHQLPHDCLKA